MCFSRLPFVWVGVRSVPRLSRNPTEDHSHDFEEQHISGDGDGGNPVHFKRVICGISKNGIPVSGETGYTNPAACLGGGCTTENPDRVRQPCYGSQCYKRTRTNKSSEVIFEVIRAG